MLGYRFKDLRIFFESSTARQKECGLRIFQEANQISSKAVRQCLDQNHELLFIYVLTERNGTTLPKFVTTTQNANFRCKLYVRQPGLYH